MLHAAAMAQRAAQREVAYLWPCNVPSWHAWSAVQTQWRTGMAGATGLDYAGVRAWLELQDLDADARRDIFAGIQACEGATLAVWSEQRAARASD